MKKPIKNKAAEELVPGPEALINYFNDQLSAAEKRKMEEMMTDDPLIGDAVEGLHQLQEINELENINQSLERMIDRKIGKKNKKKVLKAMRYPLWMILLITITLLAILGGYVLISLLEK